MVPPHVDKPASDRRGLERSVNSLLVHHVPVRDAQEHCRRLHCSKKVGVYKVCVCKRVWQAHHHKISLLSKTFAVRTPRSAQPRERWFGCLSRCWCWGGRANHIHPKSNRTFCNRSSNVAVSENADRFVVQGRVRIWKHCAAGIAATPCVACVCMRESERGGERERERTMGRGSVTWEMSRDKLVPRYYLYIYIYT